MFSFVTKYLNLSKDLKDVSESGEFPIVEVTDTYHSPGYLDQKLRHRFRKYWSGTKSIACGRYLIIVK